MKRTLRELREDRNLTQYELAALAELSQGAISQLESGRRVVNKDALAVGPEGRDRLAKAVGVTADQIAWDGEDWLIAETVRLTVRAAETGMRGFACQAMKRLMSWLEATRTVGRNVPAFQADGEDDAA